MSRAKTAIVTIALVLSLTATTGILFPFAGTDSRRNVCTAAKRPALASDDKYAIYIHKLV